MLRRITNAEKTLMLQKFHQEVLLKIQIIVFYFEDFSLSFDLSGFAQANKKEKIFN